MALSFRSRIEEYILTYDNNSYNFLFDRLNSKQWAYVCSRYVILEIMKLISNFSSQGSHEFMKSMYISREGAGDETLYQWKDRQTFIKYIE